MDKFKIREFRFIFAFLFLLISCQSPIKDGYYTCTPFTPDNCPEGWTCQLRGTSGVYKCYKSGSEYCGNGVLEANEECDGPEISESACQSGYPICLPNCRIYCTECGNGIVEINERGIGEECDDGNTFDGDGCSAECKLERSYCNEYEPGICDKYCGDGIVNGPEVCDGSDFADYGCQSFGYYGGHLVCGEDCRTISTEYCEGYCGDGIINGNEECDGLEQSGEFCTDYASDAGTLYCNAWCQKSGHQCHKFWEKQDAGSFNDIFDGEFFDENNIFVCGENGFISHFDGYSWNIQSVPSSGFIKHLWGLDPDDVYAVDTTGNILHYNGNAWELVIAYAGSVFNSIWGSDYSNIYVVGYGSSIKHYNGNGWSTAFNLSQVLYLYDIWGYDANHIYAVGEKSTVVFYDGHNWTEYRFPDENYVFTSITGKSPDRFFIGGYYHGTLEPVLFAYNGTEFLPINLNSSDLIMDLKFDEQGRLMILEQQGNVLRLNTSDFSVYESHTSPYMGRYSTIIPLQRDQFLILGHNGMILKHNGSWRQILSKTVQENVFMSSMDQSGIIAVGRDFVKYFNGDFWTEYSGTVLLDDLQGVWAYDQNNIYAFTVGFNSSSGGLESFIYSRTSSSDWSPVWYSAHEIINYLWGIDPSDVYAVGQSGLFLHYDGSEWTRIPTGFSENFYSVWGTEPDNLYIVGKNGYLIHYDGNVFTKINTFIDENLYVINGIDENNIYIVGQEGTLMYFNGQNWKLKPFPYKASLNGISGISNSDVYVSAENSLLLHYDGLTWSPVKTDFGIDMSSIVTDSQHKLYVLTEQGIFLYETQALSLKSKRCKEPIQVYCETTVHGDIEIDTENNFSVYDNIEEDGGEVFYRFESPVTGEVILDLTGEAVDLFVIKGDMADICLNGNMNVVASETSDGSYGQVSFFVSKGTVFYIVADSKTPVNTFPHSEFSISVNCRKSF